MNSKNKNILNNIKGTGFKTPSDYFENLNPNIQENRKTAKNGFKVPVGYFDDFESNFDLKDNLNITRSTGFTTPNNYFKNLNPEIDSKLKKSKIIPLYKRSFILKTGLAIAASFLLLFSISKYSFNNESENYAADSEFETWLEEGLISFNTIEIEDVFSDEDLNLIAEETDEISDYLKYTDIEVLLLEN